MKDAIGQEIKVGDKIVQCGGRFAQGKVHTVEALTAKRVKLPHDGYQLAGTYLAPDTVVVVTGNLIRLALNSENPKCDYCGRNPNGEPQPDWPEC